MTQPLLACPVAELDFALCLKNRRRYYDMVSFNHARVTGDKNVVPCVSRPASLMAGLTLAGAGLFLALLGPACRARSDQKSLAPGAADASPRAVHCLGRVLPGEKVLVLAAPPESIVKDLLVRRHDRVRRGQTIVIFNGFDAASRSTAILSWPLRTRLLSRSRKVLIGGFGAQVFQALSEDGLLDGTRGAFRFRSMNSQIATSTKTATTR